MIWIVAKRLMIEWFGYWPTNPVAHRSWSVAITAPGKDPRCAEPARRRPPQARRLDSAPGSAFAQGSTAVIETTDDEPRSFRFTVGKPAGPASKAKRA
jgi:hypothetical protein